MDSEVIADLKQFISAELRQQTTSMEESLRSEMHELRVELKSELKSEISRLESQALETKNEILDAIGETMTTRDDVVDNQIADLDARVTKLEQQTA